MLKEAIQLLMDKAVSAAGPHRMAESRDGRSAMFLMPDGVIENVDVGPYPRCHHFGSLDDLAGFATRFSDASVWHKKDAVVVLCDDQKRQDMGTLVLEWSREYRVLDKLDHGEDKYAQAAFVRLLHRELGVDASIVAAFRRLDFQVLQASYGEFSHGKDRMGKSVQADVQGSQDIPDEITVTVPIYETPGERAPEPIACGVDLEPQNSVIRFRPLPGELSKALESRQVDIRRRLVALLGNGAKIYFGAP